MDDSQGCCLCLLFLLSTGPYTVSGTISIYGCLGDAVKLFQNNGTEKNFTVESIYKKNLDDTHIMRVVKNGNKTIHFVSNGHDNRMFPDQNGDIWIINLHLSDEGTYSVKIDAENVSFMYEVPLLVMIPPTKNCIPKIIRVDNSLSAHLKADECGRPAASVHWLEHPGTDIAKEVIKLRPRMDNGVYHACIEGDALKCAKISNVSNFCSVYSYSKSEPLIDQEVAEVSNPSMLLGNVPFASPGQTAVLISTFAIVAFGFVLFGVYIVRRAVQLYQRRKMQSDVLLSVDPSVADGSNPSNVIGESQLLIVQGLTGGPTPNKKPEQISCEEDMFESLEKHPGEGTTPKSFVTTRRGAIPMHPVED